MLKKLLAAALTAALLPAAAVAATNAYPTKPVRFVVPYPAGGPLDTVARAIGEKLRDSLGQPVVVENKPGAGGNLGADYVAKQPADGYTIVMGAVATHAINPTLFSKMPYDPVKDFAPITLVADVPNVLVMHPGKAAELLDQAAQERAGMDLDPLPGCAEHAGDVPSFGCAALQLRGEAPVLPGQAVVIGPAEVAVLD